MSNLLDLRGLFFLGINLLQEEFMRSRLRGYEDVMECAGLTAESYFIQNSSRVAEAKTRELLSYNTEKNCFCMCF